MFDMKLTNVGVKMLESITDKDIETAKNYADSIEEPEPAPEGNGIWVEDSEATKELLFQIWAGYGDTTDTTDTTDIHFDDIVGDDIDLTDIENF